ncbi:MAG: hypothetical protein GY953_07890 [bacterium]|nr:hypothetical protein [bacterium]
MGLELWALPFSLETLRVTSKAFLIAQHAIDASVAADGTLVFHHYKGPQAAQLAWLDRKGEKRETIGRVTILGTPRLSPDGAFVAYSGSERSIWLYDLVRRRNIRLTTDPGTLDNLPTWSPTGEYVAFTSNRTGGRNIFVQRADGSGEAKALTDTGMNWVTDWSRDGKYLFYEEIGTDRAGDIWYLERSADGSKWQPKPYLQTLHGERFAALSPDGRFVAYLSKETGREELYVRPFPEGDDRWTVSSGGAFRPRWRSDGRELYYESQGTLMAVPVSTQPSFSMGTPARLFALSDSFDVSSDGQRFLVAERVENAPRRTIRVVENWFAEFRDRQ